MTTIYKLPRFGQEDEQQRIYLQKLVNILATAAGPPSGPAGGVLTGTYPNPGLANTAITPATYGDATHVGQFTVAADGRITAASNVAISGGGGGSGADPIFQIGLAGGGM